MKKILILMGIILILTGCMSEKRKELTKTDLIVPTMQDKIGENGLWVGTFQLVWTDLKNEVVKKDIEIDHEYARNLNKGLYQETDLSSEYYYKKYGKAFNIFQYSFIDIYNVNEKMYIRVFAVYDNGLPYIAQYCEE